MLETQILPAPSIPPASTADDKWSRERRSFLQLLPTLLATHRGKYVAIHQGRVVHAGDDQIKVALGAYAQVGYVAIYVGLVTDEPPPVARIPSPRLPRRASP